MIWEVKVCEIGRRGDTGEAVVRLTRYFRPLRLKPLGIRKAKEKLADSRTTLEELVAEMVANDMEEAKKEAYLRREGFDIVGARE